MNGNLFMKYYALYSFDINFSKANINNPTMIQLVS